MTTETPQKASNEQVFLSYARGDAQELAARLRKALEADGVTVWQDIERIDGGDWAGQLQRALDGSDAMLALLTPCAVGRGGPGCERTSDSVCLDEIYYARFAQRRVPIVPLMVRACQPPFVIYRLHYHDFTRITNEAEFSRALDAVIDLARAGDGEDRYRSFVDRLMPLDFDSFLGSKRRGFVGRDWLFRQVEDFVAKPSGRALLIEGDAGIGKSSFLANLIQRNPNAAVIAYHCCQADTPATLRPGEFVRTIASMIAGQHAAYAAELETPSVAERLRPDEVERDPASAFELGVLSPLSRLPPPEGGTRILVIDALDEALLLPRERPSDPAPFTIVDLLSTRIDRFPAWLKLLATTRPERPVKDRLTFPSEVIRADDPLNRSDLDSFIRSRLSSSPLKELLVKEKRDLDSVALRLAELADGNFLYASQVLTEVAEGVYGLAELGGLPRTLKLKYRWFLARQFPDAATFAPVGEVLEVLVAAETSLPRSDLARALGRTSVQLTPLLNRLGSFIRSEPGQEPAYAVYHKSMVEWLTDPERVGELHSVTPLEGHKRIADRFLAVLDGDGAEALSRYAIRHLPLHLAACADGAQDEQERSHRLEQLVRFVLNPGVQTHSLQRPALVNDALRLALGRAARSSDPRCVSLVFEAAWGLLSFRRSQLRPDHLFELAQARQLEDFTHELDAYPADVRFRDLANVLAVWLVHGEDPAAAAAFRANLRLSPQTDQSLLRRLDAVLSGAPSPLAPPSDGASEHEARAILASVGGADLEGTSGYAMPAEALHVPSPEQVQRYQQGGDELPVMLSEIHGPRLLAFASSAGERGIQLFRDYIAIQASNQYPIYRDLSLYKLVPSIVRHPDDAAALKLLLELAKAALSGGELEFAEPAWLALLAFRSRIAGDTRFDEQLAEMERNARTLEEGRERGDLWGEHRRRFAAAAEAKSRILAGDATQLVDRARALPRGYSGMEAYARLTLSESLLICRGPTESIQQELTEAETSAQNIQDTCYCALTTARVDTLRLRYWDGLLDDKTFDVEREIRLLEGREAGAWSIDHRVAREYPRRRQDNNSLPLPDWMLSASTPAMISSVYQVSVEELLSLNPTLTGPHAALERDARVRVPDPGFRALLAAFFSAVVLISPQIPDAKRVTLVKRLVPLALAKPTALQTVLGRLVVAAVRGGAPLPYDLEEFASSYAKGATVPRRPAGRALTIEHLQSDARKDLD